MAEPEGGADAAESPAKRRLEAAAAAIGAALAAATLGIILWDGIRDEGRPALVVVRAEATHPHPGGYVVEIVAENAGDATAASLVVEASLLTGEDVVETSEVTFDYLPSRSARRGGLVFSRNPAAFRLTLQARSYSEP